MKVSYYCQHVLGIGHFHRSMEICKAIARRHPTSLILGGPPVEINNPDLEIVKLPGLQMDTEFQNMEPCDEGLSLEEVKARRVEKLFAHFLGNQPDIFITELYPFGRKAFRFELDPLLKSIRDGSLSPCSCYCSVRDILVEKKTGREKFEKRVVQTINSYFDGILVHADPAVIPLQETFGRLQEITVPLHYTGFVTRPNPTGEREEIKRQLCLFPEKKLIVASIGGGNVGSALLQATIESFRILTSSNDAHLQLFCGPYCEESTFQQLQKSSRNDISIDRFTNRFPDWLQAADLSISMAGYNTCMNLLQAGIPALVYPFGQNREQLLRAKRLGKKIPLTILQENDLTPSILAQKIISHLAIPRFSSDINLNGAQNTAKKLESWFKENPDHD